MGPTPTADQAALIFDARRATLGTIAPHGQLRLVSCRATLLSGGRRVTGSQATFLSPR